MEVSKIRNMFALNWIQLKVESNNRFYALVPRDQFNNAESHGYICEVAKHRWKCAAVDLDGEMMELGIQPRKIDAQQAVQKRVIQTNRELAKTKEAEQCLTN